MRLDARRGDYPYTVYHAEECRVLKSVVWVDDVDARWAEILMPPRVEGDELALQEFQARSITILLEQRLVIINPVADEDDGDAAATEVVSRKFDESTLGA